jgi:hypothetical protein
MHGCLLRSKEFNGRRKGDSDVYTLLGGEIRNSQDITEKDLKELESWAQYPERHLETCKTHVTWEHVF